jgi:ubiquinone/menaquinone biosynthesis C-methylase UbiE
MPTQLLADDSLIMQARNSKGDCAHLYDEWATTYNTDLTETHSYVAPVVVAEAALKSGKFHASARILDAGCGTGLVGEALVARGGGTALIDGIDFSPAMLEVAEKTGAYRSLETGDLTRPIARPDEEYDLVTCGGTFAPGHVGPEPALREFVRTARRNGVVIATVHQLVWLSGGYKAEIEKLEAEGLVKVVSAELEDYRKGHDKARLVILEKM